MDGFGLLEGGDEIERKAKSVTQNDAIGIDNF